MMTGRTMRIGLLVGALVLGAAGAGAEDAPLTITDGTRMRDLLSKRVGKTVTLRLHGGEELSGKVQTVGGELVHLSPVTGRDFFDAVVTLDAIQAVLVRVRGS
jgi:hypothetical protein